MAQPRSSRTSRSRAQPDGIAEELGGAEVAHLRGIGGIELRGFDLFDGRVYPRDLVLGAPERTENEEILLGIRKDDPLASPCPHDRPDREAHDVPPKTFGYRLTVASQSSLCPKRMTV